MTSNVNMYMFKFPFIFIENLKNINLQDESKMLSEILVNPVCTVYVAFSTLVAIYVVDVDKKP